MAAQAFPERIAIVCGQSRVSYGQLYDHALKAAARFKRKGTPLVALYDVSSPATAVALFACAYAGIPYVPINYRLTKPEIRALLERISPALLITGERYAPAVAEVPNIATVSTERFLNLLGGLQDSLADDELSESADEVAVQLFTSGTSGPPKAALLRHKHISSYILNSMEFGAAEESEATLTSVPPYHIAGISAILSSTFMGRRLVQLPNFVAEDWFSLIESERVTHAFLVPTMLTRIIESMEEDPLLKPKISSLKAVSYGGGKMPASTIVKALEVMPDVAFTNAYGLTETSSTITVLTPGDHWEAIRSEVPNARMRLASVGRALPGIEIQIRDENAVILPIDEYGNVYVRGPQIAGEYAKTGSLLDKDGWFSTQDYGYLDDLGYLFLGGRSDDVIVRGGENISPFEIEEVLHTHPTVQDAAVFAVPDEQWGETVAAAIVLKEGAIANAEELKALVRDKLRSSRTPQVIFFVDGLPYNETGKLQRRMLRKEYS